MTMEAIKVKAIDPESEAAYFASIWGLSTPKMNQLAEAFRRYRDAPPEPGSAIDAVRALIRPDSVIAASDIQLQEYPRKAVFNALTYLTRTGELTHVGYGKYQSPSADPEETTSEHIARDIREGRFPERSEPQERVARSEELLERITDALEARAAKGPTLPPWRHMAIAVLDALEDGAP